VVPALLITLREGLEAALIVTLIAAYLARTGRRDALPKVWVGVAAALAVSTAAGLVVALGAAELSTRQQELFEGFASAAAAGVLTWMIFWMRRQARSIKGELEEKTDKALESGRATALAGLAFVAVVREGLETVLFMYATFKSSSSAVATGSGAVLGIVAAVLIGYGIYVGGVRLNLRRFFQITGGLIVIVSAGLLASAVHELNEGGLLLFATGRAYDASGILGPNGVMGSVLRGLFGYEPRPTVLQVVVYWAYLVPTMIAFYGIPRAWRRAPAVEHARAH
jgi:high-affinity iron transporter